MILAAIEKAYTDLEEQQKSGYGGQNTDYAKREGIVQTLFGILEEMKISEKDFPKIADWLERLRINKELDLCRFHDTRIDALITEFRQ